MFQHTVLGRLGYESDYTINTMVTHMMMMMTIAIAFIFINGKINLNFNRRAKSVTVAFYTEITISRFLAVLFRTNLSYRWVVSKVKRAMLILPQ